MNSQGSFICSHENCNSSYNFASSLSRHVRAKHGGAKIIKASVSIRPKVKCRHSDCFTYCDTKHRRRHEKKHKVLCQNPNCLACTKPHEFKRGRRPKKLVVAPKSSILPSLRELYYWPNQVFNLTLNPFCSFQ
ncbi:hypothetical protein ACTA71_012529 [Dictyostelium dimigraforme]